VCVCVCVCADVLGKASEITASLSFSADGFGRSSAKASDRRPVRDVYLLGLILVSVGGGLLLVLTLYCLVTQKVRFISTSRVNRRVPVALHPSGPR